MIHRTRLIRVTLPLLFAAITLLASGSFAEPGDVDLGLDFDAPVADDTQPPADEAGESVILPPDQERLWKRNWFLYAKHFTRMGEDYFFCHTYDRRYESSAHLTLTQAITDKTVTVTQRGGGIKRRKTIKPDIAEAEAAAVILPKFAMGQYGYIRSCKIERVIDEQTVVISTIELVDAKATQRERSVEEQQIRGLTDGQDILETRFESRENLATLQRSNVLKRPIILRGYSTAGLIEGSRWTGPKESKYGIHVALVDQVVVADAQLRGGSNFSVRGGQSQAVVAVPPSVFGKPLSEQEFVAMLATRKMTPSSFCQLLEKEMVADPKTVRSKMFAYLFEGRPKSEEADSTDDDANARRRSSQRRADADSDGPVDGERTEQDKPPVPGIAPGDGREASGDKSRSTNDDSLFDFDSDFK